MIRRAVAADADTLSRLAVTTFFETFVDGFGIPYPPADRDAYIAEKLAAAVFAGRIADPAFGVWVAEHDGEAVGFAVAGPNGLPHADARDGDLELKQLYLTRAVQGLGLGGRLFETTLAWMEAQAPGAIWIGVWSGNLKAQRLYQALGFEKAGGYQFRVGSWLDDELILRRTGR
ncbi:Acetyltransferase (GNAT) family protein [Sphingomonas laterariae]|uniref:Acetyltransferase (GNAT) family protein n=1 Tax=Edaphosphingomonas laterariae TaxID=861865 RepID=A0A239E9H4_9SPHN|nr:GNAT family N-acetyltransferase [Sphingomonas laterariae]SNS41267.1 Acetyltransferase (GNAT) family protein [Sphingomonas laterariae]